MSPMFALYFWPAISAVILGKLRLPLAILVVLFSGYMFLPVRFSIDFPMIPPMGKHVIPVLTVVIATTMIASLRQPTPHQPGLLPNNLLAQALIALLLLGAVGTALANGDQIVTPLEVKSGLKLYEGISMATGYIYPSSQS